MVTAVVNHIIETLPTTGEGYCAPLYEDYLRTLTILLGIPHHVEHLSGEGWNELIEFCLQGIRLEEQDSQKSDQNGYHQSPGLTEPNSGRSTPSRNTKAVPIRSSRPTARAGMDDLMICLECLTAAPNCPILAVSERLFEDIASALSKASPTSKSSCSAFAALNSTLLRTLTEKPDHSLP